MYVTDEWTCPQQAVVTGEGSLITTGGDFWRCDNMECVHRPQICNDVYDCKDKSDERRCRMTNYLFYNITRPRQAVRGGVYTMSRTDTERISMTAWR